MSFVHDISDPLLILNKMATAILENEKSLPRPSNAASIMPPKENETKKQAKATGTKDKSPLVTTVGASGHNPKEPRSTVSAPKVSAKETATAIKTYNSEVLGILKELSSNQNKFSDKLEKLSSRVDSIYDYDQYVDNQSEGSHITEQFDQDQDFENYPYDAAQDDCADPPLLEDDCNESSPKQQKTDGSIFKNISEKFNPKEVTDHDIDLDLKDFINATFRDGISDDQQTDLVKNIHRPGNTLALVKTKVNQCIWRLLKPQTQSDDVKMQTIQNDMIKASINVAKILNEAGQSMSADVLNLGTGALALLGQANKLLNNKRKESHKKDLDVRYHYLCSANFPFSEWLYGDDVNKNVKEIQDMNKLGKNVGSNQRGGYGHGRGRRGYPRYSPYSTRGRGRFFRGNNKPTDNTNTGSGSKNSKAGFKKHNN